MLKPFVRGEGTRIHADAGVGLGLSIVHAIVTALNGEISTSTRSTGGLDITIHLPTPIEEQR